MAEQLTVPEPCDKDDWTCECPKCEAYWDAIDQLDAELIHSVKEYDDEGEHEAAQTFEIDGW